jgi:regulator of protease activity HflC (stomatin/prohibitin superfamily)
MVDISRYPLIRHLRGTATTHVQHIRNGTLVHSGTGLSFWFRPLSAVLSEVPIADQELPLLFHAQTSDFQDLTVQATATYRIREPELAATRIDFSVDPDLGLWRGNPLQQVAGLLTETVQQPALRTLAGLSLTEAVARGIDAVAAAVEPVLADDARLREIGLSVISLKVVAIRPEPEMEKALRTPARELVQQEADRATYERRAMAVERERSISENELQNQIELARREEQLVAQRGANTRREAEENSLADQVAADAEASRLRTLAEAEAGRTRNLGAARAEAEGALLAAYRDVPAHVLWSLAAREVGEHLPEIGSLVVTPDLLASLVAKLGTGNESGS